jgi:tRNA(fMet)-specific endonuclease VapC
MKKRRYMLDTNTASYVIKGSPLSVRERLRAAAPAVICVSTITEAELLHGAAKKPEVKSLRKIVGEFLHRTEILPWDSNAAAAYARFRVDCEREGKSLATMDMLIAAHAVAAGAVLVTGDKAFCRLEGRLALEDWTAD